MTKLSNSIKYDDFMRDKNLLGLSQLEADLKWYDQWKRDHFSKKNIGIEQQPYQPRIPVSTTSAESTKPDPKDAKIAALQRQVNILNDQILSLAKTMTVMAQQIAELKDANNERRDEEREAAVDDGRAGDPELA